MKIIWWNVNGLRAAERKGTLAQLLEQERPTLGLWQEIKGTPEQFSGALLNPVEYQAFYNPAEKAGYAGTGTWIHQDFSAENLAVITQFPGNPNADEGRMLQLNFEHQQKKYAVINLYFPNGGKSEQAWAEKLIFYDRFLEYINDLHQQGYIVLWGGDLNVAHQEIDLARPKENEGVIGFHPKERAWVDRVLAAGWCDIFRQQYPNKTEVYSWWHLITRARDRNIGWRIDYAFVHQDFSADWQNIRYANEQMGSDHCPLILESTAKSEP